MIRVQKNDVTVLGKKIEDYETYTTTGDAFYTLDYLDVTKASTDKILKVTLKDNHTYTYKDRGNNDIYVDFDSTKSPDKQYNDKYKYVIYESQSHPGTYFFTYYTHNKKKEVYFIKKDGRF